jgi:predicted metal-dependent hydrolase
MGLSYPLQLCKGSKSGVELADGHIKVTVSSRVKPENENGHIKKCVQDWYKQQLSQYLCHRTDYFAEQISVAPTQVIVKSYKRRWGSCNSNGLLSFNYLLMMAPAWVIDYVIVHELCHLIHMNHSAHFWAEVNRYYPEHQQAKQWLKVEGGGLYV